MLVCENCNGALKTLQVYGGPAFAHTNNGVDTAISDCTEPLPKKFRIPSDVRVKSVRIGPSTVRGQ